MGVSPGYKNTSWRNPPKTQPKKGATMGIYVVVSTSCIKFGPRGRTHNYATIKTGTLTQK